MKNKVVIGSVLVLLIIIGSVFLTSSAFSQNTYDLPDGLYVEFKTTKGDMVAELFYQQVPMTVTNFVGLAEGTIEHDYMNERQKFYDGLIFHRVIKDFMIQGGCPDGNGRGNPGYRFPDEIDDRLKHTGKGILSMANSGPNTNGSQFFITHKATPWLDGKHTVFGKLVIGEEVLDTIATTPVGAQDRPTEDIVMNEVNILRIGSAANAFKADQAAFDAIQAEAKTISAEKTKAEVAAFEKMVTEKWPDAVTTESGLRYVVTQPGDGGAKPAKGTEVTADYTGMFVDGSKFDSSIDRGKPFKFKVGMGQVIKGWDEAFLDMTKGEKRTLIIPYPLAYGENGRPPVIPPKATLIFDVELIDFQ